SLLRDYGDRMTPERRQSGMNQIEASVRQLIQTLDDIMIVGQIESGYMQCTPEATDASHYIGEIIHELSVLDGGVHRIVFEAPDNMVTNIDRKLVRQIVANLVSNAIKYSPVDGEVRVALEYGDNAILLNVCDQGIGIPEDDQIRLFESFHRASNVGQIPG